MLPLFIFWKIWYVTSPQSVLPFLSFPSSVIVPLWTSVPLIFPFCVFHSPLSLVFRILSCYAVSPFPSDLPPLSSVFTCHSDSLLCLPPFLSLLSSFLPPLLRLVMKSWRSMARAPRAWSTREPSSLSRVEAGVSIWCSRGVTAQCLNMVGQSTKTFPSPQSSHPEPGDAQWTVVGRRGKRGKN